MRGPTILPKSEILIFIYLRRETVIASHVQSWLAPLDQEHSSPAVPLMILEGWDDVHCLCKAVQGCHEVGGVWNKGNIWLNFGIVQMPPPPFPLESHRSKSKSRCSGYWFEKIGQMTAKPKFHLTNCIWVDTWWPAGLSRAPQFWKPDSLVDGQDNNP